MKTKIFQHPGTISPDKLSEEVNSFIEKMGNEHSTFEVIDIKLSTTSFASNNSAAIINTILLMYKI